MSATIWTKWECGAGSRWITAHKAFEDNAAIEVEDLLRYVAGRVSRGETEGSLLDINSNRVGHFEFKGKRPE